MDLTQYCSSPYAPGGIARNTQRNPLSAALRGFLGQEEPGSVLQPDQAGLSNWNSVGQAASHIADMATALPMKGVAAMGALVPLLVGKRKLSNETLQSAVIAGLLRDRGVQPSKIYSTTGLVRNPALGHGYDVPEWSKYYSIAAPGEKPSQLAKRLRTKSGTVRELLDPDAPIMREAGDAVGDIAITQRSMPAGYSGSWHPEDRKIELSTAVTEDPQVLSTVIHELTHGANSSMNSAFNAGSSWNRPNPLKARNKQAFGEIADTFDAVGGPGNKWLASQLRLGANSPYPYSSSSGEWLARTAERAGLADLYKTGSPSVGYGDNTLSDAVADTLYGQLNYGLPRDWMSNPNVLEYMYDSLISGLRGQKLPVQSLGTQTTSARTTPSLSSNTVNPLHAQYDFHVDPQDRSVYVYLKGDKPQPGYANAVAWLAAEPAYGKNWAEDVMVNEAHRGKGLATEMYQAMVDAGLPMAKSNDVTSAGEAMWRAWHRSGLAKDNEFIGRKP